MILEKMSEFRQYQKQSKRIIGLDVGTKKTGVAISDKTKLIATPYQIITSQSIEQLAVILHDIIEQHDTSLIVMGWPLELDSSEGKMCMYIKELIAQLLQRVTLHIYLHDERFSSRFIDKDLRNIGIKKGKRRIIYDEIVASYLLQEVLNQLQ